MTDFWWPQPPASFPRPPHAIRLFWHAAPGRPAVSALGLGMALGLAVGLALTLPLPARAQAPSPALQASDPDTPSAPPAALSPPVPLAGPAPDLPTDINSARALWQRANQRVAEFPRGHIDLLRWEAQQPARPATLPAEAAPQPPALDMASALRLSLRQRPELFTHAGMNRLDSDRVQRAYAQHRRALHSAWIDAVSARQRLRLQGDLLEAAVSGAELGRRMVQAGNWSQARWLREQLTEAQAQQAWGRAVQAQQDATEQLARLLGLWDAQAVAQLVQRLPAELPEPPNPPAAPSADIEAAALRSQPPLADQRLSAQQALAAVGMARLSAWSQAVADALATPDSSPDTTPLRAPQIGDQRLVQDHALQAAVRAESALLNAAAQRRSMARLAWGQLRSQHANAQQAQQVLRLHTAQEQETLLRYNGMLQSSWDLLASASARMSAADAAQQARRAYWLAQADWDALMAGADVTPTASGMTADKATPANSGAH